MSCSNTCTCGISSALVPVPVLVLVSVSSEQSTVVDGVADEESDEARLVTDGPIILAQVPPHLTHERGRDEEGRRVLAMAARESERQYSLK